MTLHLTYEEVANDLAAIAAEHPGKYVDPFGREVGKLYDRDADGNFVEANNPDRDGSSAECMYFDPTDGTTPACIVGHVLARHGVVMADLDMVDNEPAVKGNSGHTVGQLARHGFLEADTDTLAALDSAQVAQDGAVEWRDAVRRALSDRDEVTKTFREHQ